MARREYKGGAPQIILSGNIAASGVTTINTTGTVTAWPTGATGKFLIVIDKGLASEEKIFCNGRTGNALALVGDADRGADGTSATTHSSGATINHCAGAIDVDEPNAHINVTANDDHTQYLNTTRHAAVSHTTAMIADANITTVKILDANVTTAKIANANVTLAKLASEAATAWTPTFTNFTIGNGTIVARYLKFGRQVFFRVEVTLGSTSTMSNNPRFDLPVACSTTYAVGVNTLGMGLIYDASSGALYQAAVVNNYAPDINQAVIMIFNSGSTYTSFDSITSAKPMASWAVSDVFSAWGVYEAAS